MSEWVEYMTFNGVSPMADLRKKMDMRSRGPLIILVLEMAGMWKYAAAVLCR